MNKILGEIKARSNTSVKASPLLGSAVEQTKAVVRTIDETGHREFDFTLKDFARVRT